MNTSKFIYVIAIGLLLASCTNDSALDLVDNLGLPVGQKITYNNTIKSIINNNCIQCHGSIPTNGSPMSLSTYEEVRESVLNGGLLNRISRAEGDFLMMPQGGPKLPSTKIDELNQWQTDGLLEN
jgi:mono/diheme cytochrome c family protein